MALSHLQELQNILELQERCMVLDVRPKIEFGICHLPGSQSETNSNFWRVDCSRNFTGIPLPQLLADPASCLPSSDAPKIFVLCRLGNDSQLAAEALREFDPSLDVKDVIGGLKAWSQDVDPQFPVY
jgi:adenylyltransferase/sulfurtransferase